MILNFLKKLSLLLLLLWDKSQLLNTARIFHERQQQASVSLNAAATTKMLKGGHAKLMLHFTQSKHNSYAKQNALWLIVLIFTLT